MKNKSMCWVLVVVLGAGLCTSGCGILFDAAVDHTADEAGDSMARELAAGYTIPVYRAYALGLMAAYFWAGGYWLAWHPYQPGEWTRWKHEIHQASDSNRGGPEQPVLVEKAFLRREADGSEWWRLKAVPEERENAAIFEALFAPERVRIVRLLARMGDGQVQEITFEEGQDELPPVQGFDPQAIEDHAVGTVELATGSLQLSANHVRFEAHDGGQVDFFFSKNVPGGLVKYEFKNRQGDRYTIQLTAHGTGATTELGAY